MGCPQRYDLLLTKGEVSRGLICDWEKGGAGLTVDKPSVPQSTQVSTKGDYGVRDANDYFRIIQTDWSQGAGQETYDLTTDSESAFLSSTNIDVSAKGKFKLGPAATFFADLNTASTACAGLKDNNGNPLVWRGDIEADYLLYSKDGETWTAPAATTNHPGGVPTSLCTDGEYVYGIFLGAAHKATISDITLFPGTGNSSLVNCAVTAGVIYADKSTTHQLGCFPTKTSDWVALTPSALGAINLDNGTPFGLVTSGNYAYWGTTNGMVTRVYKTMYVNGTDDIFTLVATFPTGFVGASIYAYLGDVYVGGHFDSEDAAIGKGAIYNIVSGETAALLTEVGSNANETWRVVSMSAYERGLYFLTGNGHVYRWDLVNGGYTHFMDVSAGQDLSTPDSWDKTWTMASAPADADITNTSTTAVYDGSLTLTQNDRSDLYLIAEEVTLTDSTGETLEVDVPAYFVYTTHTWVNSGVFALGIVGSVKDARVRLWTKWSAGMIMIYGELRSGASKTIASFGPIPAWVEHTFRLTLMGTHAVISCDGREVGSGTASVDSDTVYVDTSGFWIRQSGADSGVNTSSVSEVRWSDSGIFDPTFMPVVAGNSIVCARDKVWAFCQDAVTYGGCQISSSTAYSLTGSLTSSRSAGNMPTVDKWFGSVDVQLDGPLFIDDSVDPVVRWTDVVVSGLVDGDGFGPVYGTITNGDRKSFLNFPIGTMGRNISTTLMLSSTDPVNPTVNQTQTPVVAEVSVLFTPAPKTTRLYSYFIRCWEGVQDRLGGDWDQNAKAVADFLEECANCIVTVERPWGNSYQGKVEGLEYLEAPPSGKTDGREGIYKLQIRDVT